MYKTDVQGLVTDGNGTFVVEDLTRYHEMRARRRQSGEIEDLKTMIRRLEYRVAELERRENSR